MPQNGERTGFGQRASSAGFNVRWGRCWEVGGAPVVSGTFEHPKRFERWVGFAAPTSAAAFARMLVGVDRCGDLWQRTPAGTW